MIKRLSVLAIFLLVVVCGISAAQTKIEPVQVEALAVDGLRLVGDFYTLDTTARPAVLLLHELYTTRASWKPLLPALLQAGYNVLVVDLRGYGATSGKIAWGKAVVDVQTWLDWLRQQPQVRADAISVVGSSMGSNLALVGCANDSICRTTVAISPGLAYFGIDAGGALAAGTSALLVYSERDRWSAAGVPELVALATGDVEVLKFKGNIHGMHLFRTQPDLLIPALVDWLDSHLP